jgi:hypothetical protein
MKFFSIPTWLITIFMIRFSLLPANHSWRDRKFTLKDWREHQTVACRDFDKENELQATPL